MTLRSAFSNHRIKLMAACIAAALSMPALASEPPALVDEGPGWQLLLVQPEPGAQGIDALATEEPATILVMDSAEGVADSPLPDAIKAEIVPDFDGAGEPISVAVHYELAQAIAAGNDAVEFAAFAEPDSEGEAQVTELGCSTHWRHRTRSFERSFNGFDYEKNINSGGFTGDISINVPLTGNGSIDVEYAFKKNRACIPWTVKFVQSHARAVLDVGQTLLEAQGTANYATSDREVLLRPSVQTGFLVGPIPVVVGAEFPIGAGYEVNASASANVSLRSRAQGQLAVDVVCTKDGCSRNEAGSNENAVTFDDVLNPVVNGGVSIQADVKPYAFVEARGFLWDKNIGSAGVGVEVSAPSRLFHYYGNGCGNGTNDAPGAAGDTVNGGYVNVGAQIEFYWNATAFGRDRFNWFDSPVSSLGGFFREVNVKQFLRGGREHTALRGELYFNDFKFGSDKSPLSPIITGPASLGIGTQGTFTVKKRSCVPMDELLHYNIAWGDGTNSNVDAEPSASASATHTFNNFGAHTVTAKLVSDAGGRAINESTSRALTVNAIAAPLTPASITVPASDADGSFSVSWASSINTSSYQLLRSNAGGAYTLIATVAGTSISLASQPFGSNRYRVQACNNVGCSSARESGNVVVGVVPAAPAVTVTSMQCNCSNDVSWTAPAGATSYKLYWSAGTNPANAGLIYEGSLTHRAINVTGTTNVWAKACGTGGCSTFSAMKTANVYPGCE